MGGSGGLHVAEACVLGRDAGTGVFVQSLGHLTHIWPHQYGSFSGLRDWFQNGM